MDDFINYPQNDFGYFSWRVATSGYYWEDRVAKDDTYEKEIKGPLIVAVPKAIDYKIIYPLRDFPALFLEFSETKEDLQDMLLFANKYGLLVNELNTYCNLPFGECADSFGIWESSLRKMKEAVQLWEAIKSNDIAVLSKFIKWEPWGSLGNIITYFSPSTEELFRQVLRIPPHHEVYSRIIPGDLLFPAKIFLQRIINSEMNTHPTSIKLYLTNENEPIQDFSPKNLLGALWFQFSQALAGKTKYKRCVHCGKWEDTTDKKATWKAHPDCSNRARVKKAWEKKQKAGE